MRIRAILAIGLAITVISAVQARAEERGLHPLSQAPDSVAFAIERGCLPSLAEGGSIHERVERYSITAELGGEPADRLFGRGDVWIRNERGGCYIVARRGDAIELRQTVLDTMARAGSPSTPYQDSGPGSRDSNGQFRQESHCFTVRGRPGGMVMSTSADGSHAPLQLSFFIDTNGRCAHPPTQEEIAARRTERQNALVEHFADAVRVCRSIIGGTAVEEAANAAGLGLSELRRLAQSSWTDPETGAPQFFGSNATIRVGVLGRMPRGVYVVASEDGSRCLVLAGGPAPAVFEERLARELVRETADWTGGARNEYRRANGDLARGEAFTGSNGIAVFRVYLTRGAR